MILVQIILEKVKETIRKHRRKECPRPKDLPKIDHDYIHWAFI